MKRALIRDILWAGFFGGLGFAYSSYTRLPQPLMNVTVLFGAVGGALLAYVPLAWRDLIVRRRVVSLLRLHYAELESILSEETQRLEDILHQRPADATAQAELGVVAFLNEDFALSRECFSRALQVEPHNSLAMQNIGVVLERLGRLDEARHALESAVQADGNDPLRRSNLGLFYRKHVNASRAAEELRHAHDQLPDHLRIHTHWSVALLEAGAHDAALQEISTLISKDPNNADHQVHRALSWRKTGDLSKAIAEMDMATRIDPYHGRARGNLGLLHFLDRQFVDCLFDLRDAHALDPYHPPTKINYGLVLCLTGHYEQGIQFLHEARELAAELWETHYNLGRAALEQGDTETAAAALRRAVEFNEKDTDARINLGAVCLLQRRFSEAATVLSAVLKTEPRGVLAYCNLSLLYAELGRFDEAAEMATKALELEPKNPEACFRLGYALMMSDSTKEAIEVLKRAAQAMPRSLAVRWDLGLAHYGYGDYEAAASEIEWVLKTEPSFFPAHYALGCCYLQNEKMQSAAIRKMLTAVPFEPRNADLFINLGLAHYQRGQFGKAIRFYQRAVRLRPQSADDHNNLALAYARKKELEKAIAHFEKSLAINPTNPVTHSNIGLAYYFRNVTEKSVEHWNRVSQLDARYAESREAVQTAEYDDAQMAFRPLDWQRRALQLAPGLAQPRFRYLFGYIEDQWEIATQSERLKRAIWLREEIARLERRLSL